MHTCWISICIRFCRHHWGQDAVTTGGLGSTFAVGLAAGASAAAIIAGACATSIVHHRLNFQNIFFNFTIPVHSCHRSKYKKPPCRSLEDAPLLLRVAVHGRHARDKCALVHAHFVLLRAHFVLRTCNGCAHAAQKRRHGQLKAAVGQRRAVAEPRLRPRGWAHAHACARAHSSSGWCWCWRWCWCRHRCWHQGVVPVGMRVAHLRASAVPAAGSPVPRPCHRATPQGQEPRMPAHAAQLPRLHGA